MRPVSTLQGVTLGATLLLARTVSGLALAATTVTPVEELERGVSATAKGIVE